MVVYKFTKFTQQVSQTIALQPLRATINQRLSDLRQRDNFHGLVHVVSAAAKQSILSASGSTMSSATHIYEIPISGQWRIFLAPSTTPGSVIVLMIGHLNGNTLEEP